MTAAHGFISVPGWRTFQHYDPASRTPPWIKVYTELLDDDDWVRLTQRQRGILLSVWLSYGRSRAKLSADPARLRQALGDATVRRRDIDALVDAGFLAVVASASLAEGYQSASASRAREDVEVEVEVEPLTPQSGARATRANGLNPRALGTNPRAVAKRTLPERQARRWIENGLASEVPDAHLEEVIADEFGIREPELVAELASYARGRPEKIT